MSNRETFIKVVQNYIEDLFGAVHSHYYVDKLFAEEMEDEWTECEYDGTERYMDTCVRDRVQDILASKYSDRGSWPINGECLSHNESTEFVVTIMTNMKNDGWAFD